MKTKNFKTTKTTSMMILTAALIGTAGLGMQSAFADTIDLDGTVRDFQQSHPDFEGPISGVVTGLVDSTLAGDKNPDFVAADGTAGITNAATFAEWYDDVGGVNQAQSLTITLDNTITAPADEFTYTNSAFFPIDGILWGNEGQPHNYWFTYEIHDKFTYNGGEIFSFLGDDDVWVFINDKLAVDIGGVHPAAPGFVDLDAAAGALGITTGNQYDFDLYFAERHTTQSNFRIDTTIVLGDHFEKILNCDPIAAYQKSLSPTECSFTISYQGPELTIEDTVPAEWKVLHKDDINAIGECTVSSANKKDNGGSATEIVCEDVTSLNVTFELETRPSPGKGHKEGIVYKPTFCGLLKVNDGAVALNDNLEVVYSTDPLFMLATEDETLEDNDCDFDGVLDTVEFESGCMDPAKEDTDNDGLLDGLEDANQNGIVDEGETNPCNADTDGDGFGDSTEVANYPQSDPTLFDPCAAATNDICLDVDGTFSGNDGVGVNPLLFEQVTGGASLTAFGAGPPVHLVVNDFANGGIPGTWDPAPIDDDIWLEFDPVHCPTGIPSGFWNPTTDCLILDSDTSLIPFATAATCDLGIAASGTVPGNSCGPFAGPGSIVFLDGLSEGPVPNVGFYDNGEDIIIDDGDGIFN
jgi:fibro-slime domain-containing protein